VEAKRKLKKSGVELITLDDHDKILTFDTMSNAKQTPTCYELRKTDKLMEGLSEIHLSVIRSDKSY
jgi:hypothetical protein